MGMRWTHAYLSDSLGLFYLRETNLREMAVELISR